MKRHHRTALSNSRTIFSHRRHRRRGALTDLILWHCGECATAIVLGDYLFICFFARVAGVDYAAHRSHATHVD